MKELRTIGRLFESFRKHKNELSIADFARSEGVSRQVIHSQLSNVLRHLSLTTDDVFEKTGYGKRHLSPKGVSVQEELKKFVRRYDAFVSIGSRSEDRPSIRVGTTDTVSTRLLPLIRFHFESEADLDEILAGTQPIIEQELNEPLRLLRSIQEALTLDFAFTFIPNTDASHFVDDDTICMPVDCCMLCRYDHPFAKPEQRAAIENGNFDWAMLKTQTVVRPRQNATLAAFPKKLIPSGVSKYIDVRTYLEAHAHVMMANTVAFSHRLLMSEEELKYITPISLSKCGVKPVNLLLLRNKGRMRHYADNQKHVRTCQLFANVVKARMDEYIYETKYAEKIKEWLREYVMVTHSSVVPDGKNFEVKIMHGTLEFDVMPARMSPLGAKSPFIVRGYHDVRNTGSSNVSKERKGPFPIHGKIHVCEKGKSADGIKQYHLMWQETEPGVAYGTVSIIFSDADLSDKKPLIGRWLGRSTWLKDEFRPSSGGIILYRRSDEMTPRKFKQLISEHHDLNPVLDWPYGLAEIR